MAQNEYGPNRRQNNWVVRLFKILGCVAATPVILMIVAPLVVYHVYPVLFESKFNRPAYTKILNAIHDGALKQDEYERVKLPDRFSYGLNEGSVYLTHKQGGLEMVFFPTYRMRGGFWGYLYCSRPLTPKDMAPSETCPKKISCININCLRGGHGQNDNPAYLHNTAPLTKKINENWYYCSQESDGND